MSKIQVNLEFSADTKQAKQQIRELQSTIDQAISSSTQNSSFGLTPKLEQARQSAMQLKMALQSATNVDTGKLNLNKFMGQLKSSGLSVQQLAVNLRALGPEGQKAFQQMASAVASADTKIFSMSGGIKKLVNTFANTARYQASSAAINALSSGIKNTISYTKDLDKSLTDIRMVTGASAAEMAKFAKAANQAAKELATTTTKYAEASLIYFQQGLSDSEVKKRTNTTIKLANAVGQSAEQVSDWMTSIWNNFDNGSKSLEYYADVIAKLGAETASSADEIATGLEKFASIAETVGLSYEYAASALATVTAETRQSADVVGTAFKTIFARMEGLKLGETLDDGTTLNQYSAALAKVGINIKDTNGELKDMDNILDETAQRWAILSKDQQVALAQSVAGVRQYTQFIALMDNYDIMQKNIKSAKEAEGALTKMQDVYANSIEGMQDRAKAKAEELKQSLLKSDDIKAFYKTIGSLTGFVTNLVEAFGGLPGILLTVTSLLSKIYQPQITKFFQQSAFAIVDFGSKVKNAATGQGWHSDRQEQFKKETIEAAGQMEYGQEGGTASAGVAKKISEAKIALAENESKLTQEEKDLYNWKIKILEAQKEQIRQQGIEIEQLEKRNAEEADGLGLSRAQAEENKKKINNMTESSKEASNIATEHLSSGKEKKSKLARADIGYGIAESLIDAQTQAQELGYDVSNMGFEDALADVQKFVETGEVDLEKLRQKIIEINNSMQNLGKQATNEQTLSIDTEYIEKRGVAIGALQHDGERAEKLAQTLNNDSLTEEQRIDAADKIKSALADTQEKAKDVGVELDSNAYEEITEQIDKFKNEGIDDIQALIDKIKEYNKAVQEASSRAIEDTKKNAVEGALSQEKQGYNEINTATMPTGTGDIGGVTKQAEQMIAGLDKVEEGGKKTIKDGDGKSQKEKLKSLVKERKEKENLLKTEQKKLKNDKLSKKEQKAIKKQMADYNKQLEDNEEKIKDVMNETKDLAKAEEKNMKATEGLQDAMDAQGDAVGNLTEHQAELGKKSAEAQSAAKDEQDQIDKLTDSIKGGGDKVKGFAQTLSDGLSGAMDVASGLSLISNGVQSLTNKLVDGTASWQDWLTAAMSVGSGVAQLVKPIMEVVGAIGAKIAARKLSKKASAEETKQEVTDGATKSAAAIAEGTVHVGKNIAKGYAFWPAAIAGIAALIAVGAAVGFSIPKANAKKEEEEVSKRAEADQETLELIDEIQEEATAVNDLTKEYKDLAAAGESTYDVMKQLEDQIPSLLDRYKELERGIKGLDLNIPEMQAAFEYWKKTGDSSLFEQYQLEAEEKIAEAELQLSKQNASDKAFLATTGDEFKNRNTGKNVGGNLELRVRNSGRNSEALKILKEKLKDNVSQSGKILTFKTSNPKDLLETYNGLKEALSEMSDEGLGDTNVYQRVSGMLSSLGEEIGDVQLAQSKIVETAVKDFEAGESETAKAIQNKYDFKGMSSDQYKDQRDDILADIQEAYNVTLEQAEEILAKGKETKHLELGFNIFSEDGKIFSDINQKGTLAVEEVKGWFDELPEEDKTLFIGLDFMKISNKEDMLKQLEELRIAAEIEDMNAQVKEMDYDVETFEAYSEILADGNEELEKNELLSKRIAFHNMKLNKGLNTLSESWEDIAKALDPTNEKTIEYAEAIGKVKAALEEAFGYKPDTKFIQKHLSLIEQAAKGNFEAIEALQKAIAEDYVANFDYKLTFNGEKGFSEDEIKNTLFGLLDDLSKAPLELGANATISQEYLDALQEMLYNGQITEDELHKIMRMRGFEMNITGWDVVDGPETVTTRRIVSSTDGGKQTETTETITETQKIKVPIINGNKPRGTPQGDTGGSAASITRTNDSTTINNTITDKSKANNKKADEEIERYRTIDKTLERLEKEYDRLEKKRNRAFGKKHLDYLDAEIQKTSELAEVTKTKLEEAQANLLKDREAMLKYGMSTDEYGRITNYEEMMRVNIEAFNATGDEEQYERFKEELEQYEETLELVEDLKIQLEDYIHQQLDLELEKIQYKLELEIRLADIDLSRLEWQLENLTDSISDAFTKFEILAKQFEANMKKIENTKTSIEEILAQGGLTLEDLQGKSTEEIKQLLEGKEFTEDQIAALEEGLNGMYDISRELEALYDSISDIIVTSFEDMNKEFEQSIDKIEHLNSMIEGYRNLVELAGKDALGISDQLLKQLSKSQYQMANNNIIVSKAQLEQNKAALLDLEEQIALAESEGDTKRADELREAYDEIYATVQENEQALLEATTAALEARAQMFADEMNAIINVFEDAMTGIYGSFESMQEVFSQYQELTDRYIDDYEKIYELSKLNRDLTKSMDSIDTIKGKERLRDLQEEINALQESNTQMTRFEVEELQARYDLRLAEIALEEAQNAKQTVRMSRDSEGNWGYVYTADQNAIDAAQQRYEDTLYDYQSKLYSYTDEMQERLMQIPQEYSEAVRAIYEDQTLNDEERKRRIEETQEYYQSMYEHVAQQLGVVTEKAKILYNEDWSAYSAATGYKISSNREWIDSFDETIIAQITGFNTLEEAQLAFKTQSQTMLEDITSAYNEYRIDVQKTLELSGLDVKNFSESMSEYLKEAEKSAEDLAKKAEEASEKNQKIFSETVKAISDNLAEYGKKIEEWNNITLTVAETIGTLIDTYAELGEQMDEVLDKQGRIDGTATAPNTGGSSGNTYKGYQRMDEAYTGNTPADRVLTEEDIKNGELVEGTNGMYKVTIDGKDYYYRRWDDTSEEQDDQEEQNKNTPPVPTVLNNGDRVKIESTDDDGRVAIYKGKKAGIQKFIHEDNLADKEYTIKNGPLKFPKREGKFYQLNGLTYNNGKDFWIVEEKNLVKYDTGGYTGAWDSSGRLAMLHQKEIILNANDTENFLSALDILRDITKVIDLQALAQSNMLGSINAATVGAHSQIIEQEVTIHAEFPNATNHSEIEEAFDTLLNRASQFANRKNK